MRTICILFLGILFVAKISSAQVSTAQHIAINLNLASQFNGKVFEFDVYCFGLWSSQYKGTVKLKIQKTYYNPPSGPESSGLIVFTCWDYSRAKVIKLYFNGQRADNLFELGNLGDYGCKIMALMRHDKIAGYLRRNAVFN